MRLIVGEQRQKPYNVFRKDPDWPKIRDVSPHPASMMPQSIYGNAVAAFQLALWKVYRTCARGRSKEFMHDWVMGQSTRQGRPGPMSYKLPFQMGKRQVRPKSNGS